jgi:hypothetical protein
MVWLRGGHWLGCTGLRHAPTKAQPGDRDNGDQRCNQPEFGFAIHFFFPAFSIRLFNGHA